VGELLRDADLLLSPLLRKSQEILADSPKVQSFLSDVVARSKAAHFSSFKPVAVRAFLFDIDFDIDENRTVAMRLDGKSAVLVCASFLTRMIEGMGLGDAIAYTQSHDDQTKEPNKRLATATTANAAMMFAIDMVLNSPQLNKRENRKLTELAHRLDAPIAEAASSADDEKMKEVADSVNVHFLPI
ncbi:MAG: hypothetical protein AAFN40_28150, partial [Cyanobacteria bacterium J06560_6]